jgi:topoisomerase-4 subunit A
MTDKPILPGQGGGNPGPIEAVNLRKALEERYLAYALSTIMGRALPDVRDGLKPVHRRILYAMRELKLNPQSAYKKCAKIVGEVMGNYHPHGDQAIYDALVRLAQDFMVRYPLVDGQGNFGNIDGDSAAAMRYTEARWQRHPICCSKASTKTRSISNRPMMALTRNRSSCHRPSPTCLQTASGIAVGMATNIPPHNAEELCNALLHLIKHPNATIEKLVDFIPGPDFPTGGVLVEPREQIIEAYETGRGGFRLRAKWEKEDAGRGGYQIVVTEIPYQVQKSKLIERIAELMHRTQAAAAGRHSRRVGRRNPPRPRAQDPRRRSVVLMESLFKLTELEVRFGLNMNVLSAGQVPASSSLREVLRNGWNTASRRLSGAHSSALTRSSIASKFSTAI